MTWRQSSSSGRRARTALPSRPSTCRRRRRRPPTAHWSSCDPCSRRLVAAHRRPITGPLRNSGVGSSKPRPSRLDHKAGCDEQDVQLDRRRTSLIVSGAEFGQSRITITVSPWQNASSQNAVGQRARQMAINLTYGSLMRSEKQWVR